MAVVKVPSHLLKFDNCFADGGITSVSGGVITIGRISQLTDLSMLEADET